jgi:4-amino-4-deoxychorismate lyase
MFLIHFVRTLDMYYYSVNGQQDSKLSIYDRGLAYGDGIFTTAKVRNGQVCHLSQHIQRLVTSCKKLNIAIPDTNLIEQELADNARQYPSAVVKVIITAGQGGRGYSRQGNSSSNVVVSFSRFPLHYIDWQEQGISMGTSELQLGINPTLAGIKHLNRLEQVLIRQELDARAEDDLLVTNCNGIIVETSCSNVFWHKDGIWYTPSLVDSGVAGLKRQQIINTLSVSHRIEEIQAKLENIDDIQAMVITNSVMGIVPVHTFNNRSLSLQASKELVVAMSITHHD